MLTPVLGGILSTIETEEANSNTNSRVVYWGFILGGVAMVVTGVFLCLSYQLSRDNVRYDSYDEPVSIPQPWYHAWYVWLALIIVGLIVYLIASEFKRQDFGEVIGIATVVDGRYGYGLNCGGRYLIIEGFNRAGETITREVQVSPKTFEMFDIGDELDTGLE